MSDITLIRDSGDLGALRRLSETVAVTAGGSGNNTAVVGTVIDRLSFGKGSMPMSAELSVLFTATLAAAATLSVSLDLQDSADGSTFADYALLPVAVVATGPGGGGTVKGQVPFGVSLTSARRYLRLSYTPVMSAANTDTASVIAAAFFAGFDRLPQ